MKKIFSLVMLLVLLVSPKPAYAKQDCHKPSVDKFNEWYYDEQNLNVVITKQKPYDYVTLDFEDPRLLSSMQRVYPEIASLNDLRTLLAYVGFEQVSAMGNTLVTYRRFTSWSPNVDGCGDNLPPGASAADAAGSTGSGPKPPPFLLLLLALAIGVIGFLYMRKGRRNTYSAT